MDAERGAPALAQVVLSVGARPIPWHDVCEPDLFPGDSALLAQRPRCRPCSSSTC